MEAFHNLISACHFQNLRSAQLKWQWYAGVRPSFQHLPAARFPTNPSSSTAPSLIWLRESVTYGRAATATARGAVDIWREEEKEEELFGRCRDQDWERHQAGWAPPWPHAAWLNLAWRVAGLVWCDDVMHCYIRSNRANCDRNGLVAVHEICGSRNVEKEGINQTLKSHTVYLAPSGRG